MQSPQLKGKIVLITGAYQNLGAVTAETMAEIGADVVVNDLPGDQMSLIGEQLVSRLKAYGVRAEAVAADLRSSAEIQRLCRHIIEKWGRVDILVNNAGPFNLDPFLRLKEEDWDCIMDVNLKAVYLLTQMLTPVMKKNGWGRIINMCAGSAFVRNHGIYGLAKAGVQFFTESLALELGPEVTVNAVAPGQIDESLPVIERYDPTFGERYRNRAPLKALVKRKDIARLIVKLCTPCFDCVTGITLRADGGAEIARF